MISSIENVLTNELKCRKKYLPENGKTNVIYTRYPRLGAKRTGHSALISTRGRIVLEFLRDYRATRRDRFAIVPNAVPEGRTTRKCMRALFVYSDTEKRTGVLSSGQMTAVRPGAYLSRRCHARMSRVGGAAAASSSGCGRRVSPSHAAPPDIGGPVSRDFPGGGAGVRGGEGERTTTTTTTRTGGGSGGGAGDRPAGRRTFAPAHAAAAAATAAAAAAAGDIPGRLADSIPPVGRHSGNRLVALRSCAGTAHRRRTRQRTHARGERSPPTVHPPTSPRTCSPPSVSPPFGRPVTTHQYVRSHPPPSAPPKAPPFGVRSIDPLCRTTSRPYYTPPTQPSRDTGTALPPSPGSWTNCNRTAATSTSTSSPAAAVLLQVVSMDFSRGRHRRRRH